MSVHSCDDLRAAFTVADALAEEYHCPACALGSGLVDKDELGDVLLDVSGQMAHGWKIHKQLEKRPKLYEAFICALTYGVLAGQALEREATS